MNSDEVKAVVDSKLVAKLRNQFPHLGYFYIMENAAWGVDHYKLGETSNFLKRFTQYDNTNGTPTPVICRYLIVCSHYKTLEHEVKMVMKEYAYKENSLEWVHLPLAELVKIVDDLKEVDTSYSFLAQDKWDEKCVIYRPKSVLPTVETLPTSTGQRPILERKVMEGLTFLCRTSDDVICPHPPFQAFFDTCPEYERPPLTDEPKKVKVKIPKKKIKVKKDKIKVKSKQEKKEGDLSKPAVIET